MSQPRQKVVQRRLGSARVFSRTLAQLFCGRGARNWLILALAAGPLRPCADEKGLGASDTPAASARYEFRSDHDPDGIGKFFLGREIAHVMGRQGAGWLERPERGEEEKPDLLVQSLKLKPGDVVADIGAGTGYFSWRMAQAVDGSGLVYGVDIQQEMIDLFTKKMAERKITNVKAVLGSITDVRLPTNSVDLVLMVDVYHEFSHPYEMMQSICRSLKPGGRVVFVEYRLEDPAVPIKRLHRMSEAQVRKEAELHPLQWIETIKTLPRQHVIVFRKKGSPTE
ncbi:MAG: class I SAM-dependent methyltransferase [Verrucomicrobia bacterium]|nr:class I SAM-dependent methyltransferase [Verrucomicrobiota bacterium]